jgi:hypothetical protein
MDRVATGRDRKVHDIVDVEIAGQRVAAQAVGLVGLLHVERMTVGVRVDGRRADAHLGTSANHTHRDLAAIGDQDLSKHRFASGAAGKAAKETERDRLASMLLCSNITNGRDSARSSMTGSSVRGPLSHHDAWGESGLAAACVSDKHGLIARLAARQRLAAGCPAQAKTRAIFEDLGSRRTGIVDGEPPTRAT